MVRLGIVGTGRIAKRFVTDAWQELDVEITAVYNPHDGSAKKFCDEMKLEKCAYTDWNDFVATIDAAYVASPLGTHAEYVKKALEAGESMYQILVDNPTAKENVTRFATHQGYKVSYKEEGEDYILTLKK